MSTILTAKEATKRLGLKNPHFIAGYIHLGILPASKAGFVTVIDENDLKEFAEKYGIHYHDSNEIDSEQPEQNRN